MTHAWLDQLGHDLAVAAEHQLLRRLEPVEIRGREIILGGGRYLHLASNDYLGLSQHPRLQEAAIGAIRAYGTGAGASRLVGGHLTVHAQLEARFAEFKHAPASLLCPTGYLANHAVLTALAGPGDLICVDKLNHASLIDAARASGAEVRVFPHLEYGKLQRLLERRTTTSSSPRQTPSAETRDPRSETRCFIVTDSVFSMDGDVADLPALCALAERYHAILIVDEAHGTGVLGDNGAGLCELQGVADRVDVVVSTASKALGGLGGIVTGPTEVIQTLVNRARSFIYTTAVPAGQVATIQAALDVIRDEPWRRQRVLELAQRLRSRLEGLGWTMTPTRVVTPIVPLVVGSAAAALDLAAHLREQGIFAPAIRPPTVGPNASRVRLSLRADLTDDDIERVVRAVGRADANPA